MFTEITIKNLKDYYNNPEGNLYFNEKPNESNCYELVDGFSKSECLSFLLNGGQLIFIKGPAVSAYINLKA